MKDQLTLLRETPWDVLVILDACRADAFQHMLKDSREQRAGSRQHAQQQTADNRQQAQQQTADSRQQATNTAVPAAGCPPPTGRSDGCPPPAVCCRSPGNCTAGWLGKTRELMQERNPFHFCANPVCARENEKQKLGMRLFDVWRSSWAEFGSDRIPSVHPMSVNATVFACRDLGRLRFPILVHYLQPHSPYIGSPPLAMSRWGRGTCYLSKRCHDLVHPDRAVADGRVSWPEVREAYLGNLRLAWDAVLALAREMEGRRIVVTSDHGELLGEHGGKFGHEANWREPQLYEVPWLELSREAYSAEASSAAKAGQVADSSQDTTKQKLEALGYV